jgi:hypothetical protein
MRATIRTARRALLATTALLGAACGDDLIVPPPLAGTYRATEFRATFTGQAPVDVLAAGGTLSITIDQGNATSGTLSIPASLNGGTAFTASMAGTATITGGNVRFTQSADTFVRDLTWTRTDAGLRVSNQTAGSASFTITLTRQ